VKPNPGRGGCASIIRAKDCTEALTSAGDPSTTSNRMTLMAAILALEALDRLPRTMRADSEFLVVGMTVCLARWEAPRWKTNKGSCRDLAPWQRLIAAAAPHQVTWHLLKSSATLP
jgi:ribonuclease HI